MASNPRDDLFEAVQSGRMTPDEAEAKAKELGLPELAPQPQPADFDPMGEVWWTLAMTIAWIAYRTPAAVRDVWEEYRLRCSDWLWQRRRDGLDGPIHEGHFLEYRKRATLPLLAIAQAHDRATGTLPAGALTIEEAKTRLWSVLGEGIIQGTGRAKHGSRLVIPEHEWRDLVAIQEQGRDVVTQPIAGSLGFSGYEELAFRSKAILAVWQPNRMEERGLSLPPTIAPTGSGHMPLYCAAQWIATEGGSRSFDPTHLPIWERAYRNLLDRVSSDQVSVTGIRNGVRERLAGHLFASMAIQYPFCEVSFDMVLMDELHLESYAYTGEEDWKRGYDDSLRDRSGIQWSRLMVLKSEIAQWWPAGEHRPETHSGGAGRPSAMHLIEAEYDRRSAAGDRLGSLQEISTALEQWFVTTHATLRAPKATTIANRLRAKHRRSTK